MLLPDPLGQVSAGVGQHHPNVVLADEIMEPVSGVEALRALRASGQDVPVIMLTALGRDDMVETPSTPAPTTTRASRSERWCSAAGTGGPGKSGR